MDGLTIITYNGFISYWRWDGILKKKQLWKHTSVPTGDETYCNVWPLRPLHPFLMPKSEKMENNSLYSHLSIDLSGSLGSVGLLGFIFYIILRILTYDRLWSITLIHLKSRAKNWDSSPNRQKRYPQTPAKHHRSQLISAVHVGDHSSNGSTMTSNGTEIAWQNQRPSLVGGFNMF